MGAREEGRRGTGGLVCDAEADARGKLSKVCVKHTTVPK